MDRVWLNTGIGAVPTTATATATTSSSSSYSSKSQIGQVCAVGRQHSSLSSEKSAAVAPPPHKTTSKLLFRYPLTSLWPGGGGKKRGGLGLDHAVVVDENQRCVVGEGRDNDAARSEGQDGNWVMKILHVRSLWRDQENSSGVTEEEDAEDGDQHKECNQNNGDCDVCTITSNDDDGDDDEILFDRVSFSNLLKRVSLADAKLYANMSYLGNLAYSIPSIKPGNLLRNHGLRFVTSSIEKRELTPKSEEEQVSAEGHDKDGEIVEEAVVENKDQKITEKDPQNTGNQISAYAAYQIAASAASYLHSQTASIPLFKSRKLGVNLDKLDERTANKNSVDAINSDVASLMATTDSVTAVVAAKEEVKQAVADDLNSTTLSPCEWFICDDDQSGTRFFVIQGSETLASWKANLLFEPIQFEGMDVLVHRGIYEAAKGIYEQMLPEVRSHMNLYGKRARFRFTGHSLGGSLALLINLMLLIREEVPISSLLPVITFGSPSIMCGGDKLLCKLRLPTSHIQSVMMHRDIVPRAFSCNYPNHVAELLKAVNGNFRNHPCLNNLKLLYAPMGELLILQPDEKFSPHHDLLPEGSGIYLLSCPVSEASSDEKLLKAARMVFLNSPHPLEILSDRSAYGSGGTIQRDHDMNSYLKCVRGVIRQELNHIRKARRENRRKVWWPLVASRDVSIGIVEGRRTVSINGGQEQFKFSGFIRTGKESVKRFSRLVASQYMHLFVVILLPARTLLLDAYSLISFQ